MSETVGTGRDLALQATCPYKRPVRTTSFKRMFKMKERKKKQAD